MCYPSPGPRCSSHAEKNLNDAKKTGDLEKIRQAQSEYDYTPKGIKNLLNNGDLLKAEVARKRRMQQLALYKRVKKQQEKSISLLLLPESGLQQVITSNSLNAEDIDNLLTKASVKSNNNLLSSILVEQQLNETQRHLVVDLLEDNWTQQTVNVAKQSSRENNFSRELNSFQLESSYA